MINVVNLNPSKPFNSRPLPIVEVFGDTLQGEGPRLRPAIFIRSGMCNLKCEGFGCTREAPNGDIVKGCDTIHAVSPKFKDKWIEYSKFEDLLARVKPLLDNSFKPDIIITGGEPTMHWGNQVFQDMLKYFVENGYHVTIESNGSKMIEFTHVYQTRVNFSLSVKLSNSGEPQRKRLNPEAISNIIKNTNSYLKFVVNPETWETTKHEIDEIVAIAKNAKEDVQVFLMPMGETMEKQLKNIRFVFEVCAKYGYWFSPRVHILAFDDLDGV